LVWLAWLKIFAETEPQFRENTRTRLTRTPRLLEAIAEVGAPVENIILLLAGTRGAQQWFERIRQREALPVYTERGLLKFEGKLKGDLKRWWRRFYLSGQTQSEKLYAKMCAQGLVEQFVDGQPHEGLVGDLMLCMGLFTAERAPVCQRFNRDAPLHLRCVHSKKTGTECPRYCARARNRVKQLLRR